MVAGLAVLCLSGCRMTEVWSGVRTHQSGRAVELAAKTPLCACIAFENRTSNPVYIESSLEEATTGDVVVAPHANLAQRFDWAGPKPDDFYEVRAWTAEGTRLHFGTDVTFSVSALADCEKTTCQFAPMMMNVGITGRNPGDR